MGVSKMKTLFVFLHGIGDVVMLTGPLREYKKEHPNEEIDVVVLNKTSAEILKCNKNIRNVFILKLKKHPRYWNPFLYYFIDLWKIKKSIKKFNGYNKIKIVSIQTMPEIFYRIFGYQAKNKTERIAKEIGISNLSNLGSELFAESFHKKRAKAILPFKEFVVVHPFSRDPLRKLNKEDLMWIKNDAKAPLLLVGEKAEEGQFEERGIYNESILTIFEVIKNAKAFYGSDSVIAHLAGATSIPLRIISKKGKSRNGLHDWGKPEWYFPWGREVKCKKD